MAVTNPEARTHQKMSLFIVPAENTGYRGDPHVGVGGEADERAGHGYIRYNDVRVPADHVLGGEGQAFAIAQTRLGGGRVHHAMRTIALARRAFDMMCERAVSRQTRRGPLGDYQMTQEKIADSWDPDRAVPAAGAAHRVEDRQVPRLQLVRRDHRGGESCYAASAHDVVQRAMHLHGALGVSDEMPFVKMMVAASHWPSPTAPTEVHKLTVARRTLKEYEPVDSLFPSQHIPTRRAAAQDAACRPDSNTKSPNSRWRWTPGRISSRRPSSCSPNAAVTRSACGDRPAGGTRNVMAVQ